QRTSVDVGVEPCSAGVTAAPAPEPIATSLPAPTAGASDTTASPQVLCDTMNIAGVQNAPRNAAQCLLERRTLLTYIRTYHWNNGRGAPPGSIGLRGQDGTLYGPWPVSAQAGQGGAPNVNWEVYPNAVVPPGIYTIVDSDPATWSHNAESNFSGMMT